MAPLTRAKKTQGSSDLPAKSVSKVKNATSTTKRKATDDASPVVPKKTKAVKETQVKQPTISKNGLLPTKKTKSPKPTKQTKEEKKSVQEESDEDPEALEADDHPFSSGDEEDAAEALADAVDSDDEELEIEADSKALFKPGQDVGKAPEPSDASKQVSTKSNGETGVIYVGHIPHGFYEHEMRQYFSQFGDILRLRLSRSRRTGASKHFAFLEFKEAGVAEVVQKTMDNYLLFGHVLKCKLVPKSQIHDNLWKGANRRFKKIPRNKLAGNNLKKPLTESGWEKRISREEKRRSSRAQKLQDMGYEFEAPKLKGVEGVAKDNAALEEANTEGPKAIDSLLANIAATEEEAANGDDIVKEPTEKSKQDEPKPASKKTKKSSKTKKAKA